MSRISHVVLPILLLSTVPATAGPAAVGGFIYPAPGQMTGPGVLPPQLDVPATYPGMIDDTVHAARDLGFSGVLSGQSVWTFGDTLIPNGTGGTIPVANDSVSLGDTANPLLVHDVVVPGTSTPAQWIPDNAAEKASGGLARWSFGGTNVVEWFPGQGLVYYLKNDRQDPNNNVIVGAGVATVTASAAGATATRTSDTTWGSTEPRWGDIGVTFDPIDGDVYVLGHGPDPFGADVYLAKAPASRATDVSAYQYWDQSVQGWTLQRFSLSGAFGTRKLTKAMALFPNRQLGQSNPFWSNYYNSWMTVAGADVGYSDIMVMTAPKLEGPWTTPFTVASTCPTNNCGLRYAITPHPEYDLSGKTLLVTWTDSNVIHAARLRWR